MTKPRDMSKREFDAACKRRGFVSHGVLGYYFLSPPCQNTAVSIYNAGPWRRDQLAYLIAEQERTEKRDAVMELEYQRRKCEALT